ncbi:hypothetical protein K469DRAFT_239189 [Zopfia rhizophila CBS 207.26]|uniref:Uncharacterized protein n=1 Tax=Zopfia rhizophila CBS 207.26 TaxID=1314779 RepID=A0A6A6ES56_9PEZI|nr:hypothetical protein K469DRAFT_239189 [Zopfia rhizophila CBS 207.26]
MQRVCKSSRFNGFAGPQGQPDNTTRVAQIPSIDDPLSEGGITKTTDIKIQEGTVGEWHPDIQIKTHIWSDRAIFRRYWPLIWSFVAWMKTTKAIIVGKRASINSYVQPNMKSLSWWYDVHLSSCRQHMEVLPYVSLVLRKYTELGGEIKHLSATYNPSPTCIRDTLPCQLLAT